MALIVFILGVFLTVDSLSLDPVNSILAEFVGLLRRWNQPILERRRKTKTKHKLPSCFSSTCCQKSSQRVSSSQFDNTHVHAHKKQLSAQAVRGICGAERRIARRRSRSGHKKANLLVFAGKWREHNQCGAFVSDDTHAFWSGCSRPSRPTVVFFRETRA